jgi:hypothetical protein
MIAALGLLGQYPQLYNSLCGDKRAVPPELYYVLAVEQVGVLIYGLFNDALSNSDYMASDHGMLVNNELEMTWKETIVA